MRPNSKITSCRFSAVRLLIRPLETRRLGLISLLAAAGFPFLAHAYNPQTNRLIVKFADFDTATQSHLDPGVLQPLSILADMPLSHLRPSSGRNQVLALPRLLPLDQVKKIANTLAQSETVLSAEPDVRYLPQLVPTDADYGKQWYLFEAAGGINAEAAWDITTGSENTIIAVLDTGILPHFELSTRILPGYDFISSLSHANDGNGRDDDPTDPGDAAVAGECGDGEPAFDTPSSWHGTLIAGILAANTNNAAGIAGIDHHASILPVRVLGKCGGFSSDIADAIRWSAGIEDSSLPTVNSHPADVINLSFGAESACTETEQAAIDDAVAGGTVLVVAAGNQGTEAGNFSPANCDNVITVAASTRQGGETFYTNIGNIISLSAPGGNSNNDIDGIYSTSNNGLGTPDQDTFAFVSGTSFAAPMVAGAAALMKAVNPGLSPLDIRYILETSSRDFPQGTVDGFQDCIPERCGAGLLDTSAAVTAADNNTLGGTGNGVIRMGQAAACVTEDDGMVELAVNRIGGTGNVSARIEAQRISATAGSDFSAFDEIVSWGDGDNAVKRITIPVLPDNAVEGAEFFSVKITSASANVDVQAPASTTVTIVSTNGNTPKACVQATSDESEGGGAVLWLIFPGLALYLRRLIAQNAGQLKLMHRILL